MFSCDRKTVKNEACGKANVTVSLFIFGGKNEVRSLLILMPYNDIDK